MAFDIQFKLIYQGIRDVFRVRSLSNGVNVGTLNKAKEDLQNLIESTGWSLEKAMQVLRIPLEEKDHYEKALKKQH